MAKKQLKIWLSRASLCLLACALVAGMAGCGNSPSPTPAPSPSPTPSPLPAQSPEELGLAAQDIAAPAFTLPTLEGGEITLSDLKGTPVVLNFWAIRCPPCKRELPYLNAAASKYEGQVPFILINTEDNANKVKDFFGDTTLNFTVAIDENWRITSGYQTGYIPNTFLIDADGIVRYLKLGEFASEEQVLASVNLLLNS